MRKDSWSAWYDSLPQSTKSYLEKQPLWHDRDLYRAFIVGAIFGLLVGLLF